MAAEAPCEEAPSSASRVDAAAADTGRPAKRRYEAAREADSADASGFGGRESGAPAVADGPVPRDHSFASPSRPSDRHIQSGTLTAGSFDDHDRFEDYQRFISEAMQGDVHEVLPRIEQGQRVVILVVDSQGGPLGDARVVVRDGGLQSTVLEASTAADGRVFFLAEAGDSGQYQVSVTPPDGSTPTVQTIDSRQSPCRVALPTAVAQLPRQLDLALVVDTTGSMSDELEYLKAEIDDIAETINRMFPNVDQRYALIAYRDQGDEYVTRCEDFTSSLSEFRSTLAAQSARGGGDYPEAVHLALEQAGKLDWRQRDTARVLFLVGDAPPHDQFAGRAIEAVEDLRNRCVRVFPTAASGVQLKAEFIMRTAAFLTQGKYLFLTDHSGVGNLHAQPHVPDYEVEHLNRLMIRMIASELAGRRLAADEVIAIEQGTLPVLQPVAPEPWQPQQQQGQYTGAALTQPRDHADARSSRKGEAPLSYVPRWLMLAVMVVSMFAFDAISTRT
jgi:hypothetical protein